MKELNIWDKNTSPTQNLNNIILWNTHNIKNSSNIISITDIVENQSDTLKKKFLEIIFNFRKKKINNINLIKYFYIRKDFSYWWMTLINEKSNIAKSIYINDIIKIIALEMWLNENRINSITLYSNNKELGETISTLCKKLSIKLKIISDIVKLNKNDYQVNRFTKLFIIFYLIYYLLINIKLIKLKKLNFHKTKKSITIISYFFNFNKRLAKDGKFVSNYWSELIKLIENKEINSNWLHIYSANEGFSSVTEANFLLRKLNKKNINQFHFTQFSNLNFKKCIQIIKDSFKLHNLFLNFPNKNINISFNGSNTNYWPLFKSDFEKSFKYNYLVINMISFNFFEFLSSELNQQHKVIYLQENQSWEMPFIHLFNISSKATKIGFPHSGIRYWDLRYFDGKFNDNQKLDNKPKPDYVAANGPISEKFLIDDDYPKQNIVKVESLRHMHLLNKWSLKRNTDNKQKLNILILGDYSQNINYKMLKLLEKTYIFLPKNFNFIFKPHPSKENINYKLKNIKLNISIKPINILLKDTNVVYASDQTTSTNDAYYRGIPVIIFLNQQILNLSPLRNLPNVDFVDNNPELFADKIISNSNKINKVNYSDGFYLDKDMKYWNNLLMNIT